MKTSTTTIVLVVALTVVAGLFSSTIFGLVGTKTNANTNADAAAMFTGHVETVVRDVDGNIKEYRQSDNLVVHNGENCASKLLFGAAGGDTQNTASPGQSCVGEHNAGFQFIGIGTSTAAPADNNAALGAESGAQLARSQATTVTFTNATGTAGAQVVLTRTFDNSGGTTTTITESGLFNQTADGGMFARQTFTGISLNDGDQLTVTWTINIGGTSAIP